MRDPFEVLGVPADATTDQLRVAHRQLARRLHPDVAGDDAAAREAATQAMARVNEAFRIATDPNELTRFRQIEVRRARAAARAGATITIDPGPVLEPSVATALRAWVPAPPTGEAADGPPPPPPRDPRPLHEEHTTSPPLFTVPQGGAGPTTLQAPVAVHRSFRLTRQPA